MFNNVFEILLLPLFERSAGKGLSEIDFCFEQHVLFKPTVEPESGVRFSAAGKNCHHGPVCFSEDTLERFFVGLAGGGAGAGMGMNPNPSELFRCQIFFNLIFEEVCHRFVVKRNRRERAVLFDQFDVFDKQRMVRADPKPTNF